jgi:hypothetical protein
MTSESTKNRFQPQGRVKIVKGSILTPEMGGLRFVLNVANMAGKAEGDIYALFDKKWPAVKREVKGAFNTRTGAYKLGSLACTTAVQSDVWVVSLLCQDDKQQTDVVALEKSLKEVCKSAKYEKASVHVSTLLTDATPEMSELITKELVENGVSVYFYEEATGE